RLEYEVVGYRHFGESWGIKKGIIMGRPDTDAVWNELDTVIDHIYRYKSGTGLKISTTFVDEGGHFTNEVRQKCRERLGKKVFPIKGKGGDVPYTSPPKKQKIVIGGRFIGTCWWYQLGVDSGKHIIMANLRVQEPGGKYCHFPLRDDYGPAYFKSLLSEANVYDQKTKKFVWKKIPGHERNEALDCRNYANAAERTLSPDYDALERRLRGNSHAAVSAPIKRSAAPRKKINKNQFNDW
ncbi:MAG: phage terminase large subunit family protein, partial [Clostridia bacterium]|nr:phage terminase large subunit family protein [Clostridia bacterium]